ncbi:MAG: hypothetical protein ACFE9N_15950 [Promethearchaeota archaeon]
MKNEEIGFNKEDKSFLLNNQLSYAFFKRAVDFFKRKKYFDCLETVELAIKYNPIDAAFFSFKAFVLGIFLKDYKIALKEVNKALKLNPQLEPANFLKEHLIKLHFANQIYNFYI